ncbi:hypothetical protein LXL04_009559 [Taraxacum kok-saghyz]
MHEFVLSRQFDFSNSNWKDDGPYSDEQLERRVNSWVNSFGNKHLRQKGKMVIYFIQKVTFIPFFMENMLDSKNFLDLMR